MTLENHDVQFLLDGQLFTWNSDKYDTNVKKHGVTFEEAASVFFNPLTIYDADDEHSYDEEREIVIGLSDTTRLLFVCSCERESGEIIRIFSARKATYEEHTEWRNANRGRQNKKKMARTSASRQSRQRRD